MRGNASPQEVIPCGSGNCSTCLICASGLSGQEMLDQLRARLDHDDEAERAVVRDELRKITRLRMTKMLGP